MGSNFKEEGQESHYSLQVLLENLQVLLENLKVLLESNIHNIYAGKHEIFDNI